MGNIINMETVMSENVGDFFIVLSTEQLNKYKYFNQMII